jgi:hypothetical protein
MVSIWRRVSTGGQPPAGCNEDNKPPLGANQFTSIERTCWLLIFMSKLMGGYLFECRRHRALTIAYRVALTLATKYLRFKFFTPTLQFYDESMPKTLAVNINIFTVLYMAAVVIANVTTIYTSWRYHNIITLVMKKRLDKRYMIPLGEQMARTVESLAKAELEREQQRAKSSRRPSDIGRVTAAGRLKLSSAWDFLSALAKSWRKSATTASAATADFWRRFATGNQLLRLLSVTSCTTMVRFMIVTFVFETAVLSLLREEYGNHLIARRLIVGSLNNQTSAFVAAATTTSSTDAAQYQQLANIMSSQADFLTATNDSSQPLRLSARRHIGYIRDYYRMDATRLIWLYSTHLAGFFGLHLILSALDFFQLHSHVGLGLLITACMTDMLNRVREQNAWVVAASEVSVASGGGLSGQLSRRPSRWLTADWSRADDSCRTSLESLSTSSTPIASSASGTTVSPPPVVIQTNELLLQVRDVLTALRPALSLDYLVLTIYNLSVLVSLFGFFCVFMTTQQRTWTVITGLQCIRIVLALVLMRVTYHLLHSTARDIKITNQQKLVASSLSMSSSTGRAAAAGHRKQPLDDQTPADSRRHLSASQQTQGAHQSETTNGHCCTESRIEIITNYRLAKEIEQIWPTDWFVPDMKSCLTQNFYVITLVATLQQLVEVRGQIK